MFINLLSAIEADINLAQQKILRMTETPTAVNYEIQQLQEKKKKLSDLAMEYVSLQNRYKEVAGLNSIY